ncbi:hypothetical protein Hesp01_73810 [Herbidospora sp. NBRC 101105]|nr:hypothetical protein Hesp01_73810 [Herbidospora sp. NBRC 101105]
MVTAVTVVNAMAAPTSALTHRRALGELCMGYSLGASGSAAFPSARGVPMGADLLDVAWRLGARTPKNRGLGLTTKPPRQESFSIFGEKHNVRRATESVYLPSKT